MNSSDMLRASREALIQGDPHTAFGSLRGVFRLPGLADRPKELRPVLSLLVQIFRQLVGEEDAQIVQEAAEGLKSAQAFYDLGNYLIERGLPDLAACILERAALLAPGEEAIVVELCSALELDDRSAEACRVLRKEKALIAASFNCRYFLAFNSILSGDLKSAAELVPKLRVHADAAEAFKARRIDEMLRRAKLVERRGGLGLDDLRGWHFVTTGGLMLHLSPYSFQEEMRGRYAFTQDSIERCRVGLERLRAILKTWSTDGANAPQRILALPDRDSQILASAAAKLFALPLVDYHPAKPGLIVAYDLRNLTPETPTELFEHRPGQILFAHASCWTSPPPCSPT
jgi:hypothetical protein